MLDGVITSGRELPSCRRGAARRPSARRTRSRARARTPLARTTTQRLQRAHRHRIVLAADDVGRGGLPGLQAQRTRRPAPRWPPSTGRWPGSPRCGPLRWRSAFRPGAPAPPRYRAGPECRGCCPRAAGGARNWRPWMRPTSIWSVPTDDTGTFGPLRPAWPGRERGGSAGSSPRRRFTAARATRSRPSPVTVSTTIAVGRSSAGA